MHLAAVEGRCGTFILHRQLLRRVNLVFSSQGRCWCATAKTPLHFSTVVVSAVLRQAGLGVSSEDNRLYYQQHILLEELGLCFDEQKHAMLAPLWKTFPQKMPTIPSTWTPLRVIFSWVWFYFQINRSWEPLLPSHKPNLFSGYLGLICLGVSVGCEGVCWQLQVLIPEESQGTENEMSTTASAGEQLGKPLGTWEERDDWLNRAVLGKTGFLVVAMLTAFSSPEMHCFCTKTASVSSALPVPSGIRCCCLQDDFSALCLICSFRWAWSLSLGLITQKIIWLPLLNEGTHISNAENDA